MGMLEKQDCEEGAIPTNHGNSQTPPPDPLPLPERILVSEGYKLRRRIGEGGYGRVWMADTPGGDTVALKVVEGRDGDRTAFERERAAVARVRDLGLVSEYLIPVDDIEIHEEHGFLSYSMPLADDVSSNPVIDRDAYKARTLAEEISGRGRIPVPECVAICKRVLGAVKALHDKGFIHRDIKPANVIYVKGRPVLADFGLVTHEGADVSQVCSPTNKPPEGVGAMSGDLYAVAVLLYRMATGNKAESFPTSHASIPGAPFQRLAQVYVMAGEQDPSRRYVNAQAMSMALDWTLEGTEPPGSPKPQQPVSSNRTGSRNKSGHAEIDRLKGHIRNIVESAALEARTPQGELRGMTRDEFMEASNRVCLAFERRLGFTPRPVRAACMKAESVVAPNGKERKQLRDQATALAGAAAGLFVTFSGLKTMFGWGNGCLQQLLIMIFGSPILVPLALIIGGGTILLWSFRAGWRFLFTKDYSKAIADRATKVLLKGIDAAIDELWGEYSDQLSV